MISKFVVWNEIFFTIIFIFHLAHLLSLLPSPSSAPVLSLSLYQSPYAEYLKCEWNVQFRIWNAYTTSIFIWNEFSVDLSLSLIGWKIVIDCECTDSKKPACALCGIEWLTSDRNKSLLPIDFAIMCKESKKDEKNRKSTIFCKI